MKRSLPSFSPAPPEQPRVAGTLLTDFKLACGRFKLMIYSSKTILHYKRAPSSRAADHGPESATKCWTRVRVPRREREGPAWQNSAVGHKESGSWKWAANGAKLPNKSGGRQLHNRCGSIRFPGQGTGASPGSALYIYYRCLRLLLLHMANGTGLLLQALKLHLLLHFVFYKFNLKQGLITIWCGTERNIFYYEFF